MLAGDKGPPPGIMSWHCWRFQYSFDDPFHTLRMCAKNFIIFSECVHTKEIVKHCNLHNSTSGIVQCSSVTVIYNSRSVHVQVKFHQSPLSLNILNLGRFVSHCYLRFLHMGRFLMDLPSLLISIFANRDCRNEIHKDFPF